MVIGVMPSKYEELKARRKQLRVVLDRYSNQMKNPLYAQVRAKYDMVCKEIKSQFKVNHNG